MITDSIILAGYEPTMEPGDEKEYMVLYLNTIEIPIDKCQVVFGVADLDWEEANTHFNSESEVLIGTGWINVGYSPQLGQDRANCIQLCTYDEDYKVIKEFRK